MMRVLQVIGVLDRGGAETMIMNLYRAMDRSQVQFDFLVHEQRKGDYDDEICRLGGRFFRVPRFTGVNEHAYRKQVRMLLADHPEWGIVHGHIGSCAPIYLGEAKRAGRYAIAHSHAQNFLGGLPGFAFNVVAYPVRRVADYFMACSREAGIDRFGQRIVEGNRFSIVPTALTLAATSATSRLMSWRNSRWGLAGRRCLATWGAWRREESRVFAGRVRPYSPTASQRGADHGGTRAAWRTSCAGRRSAWALQRCAFSGRVRRCTRRVASHGCVRVPLYVGGAGHGGCGGARQAVFRASCPRACPSLRACARLQTRAP